MMAAPRFCTVVMKSPCEPLLVGDDVGGGLAADPGVGEVGVLRGRVVAPDGHVGDVGHGARRPCAASCALARFSSSRVMANQRSAGTSGALERAMRQFVLQGLPTTRMRTSEAAFSAMARPCGLKMPPFTLSRSPRSMPALRGTEPTSRAHDVPSKAVLRSEVARCRAAGGRRSRRAP